MFLNYAYRNVYQILSAYKNQSNEYFQNNNIVCRKYNYCRIKNIQTKNINYYLLKVN